MRRLQAAAERATEWLDRHAYFVLAAVVLLVGATAVAMAASKPLWHDEIYTVLLAGLSTADLWSANLSGVDLSPPLNTVLTHAVIRAGGSGPVAMRLPPLAGFLLAMVVVFAFVRRRSNAVIATIAALFLVFTAAYRYSYEARGYGLMMGFTAVSLWAWSEAAAQRRRSLNLPLLTLALAAGGWAHLYGLFAAAPILAGESVRAWRERRIDKPVLAAVAFSLLALIPLLPLLRAGASLAPSFWGRAGLRELAPTYTFLLNSLLDLPFLLVAAALIVVGFLARRRFISPLPRHEIAALAAGVALPLIQIVVAMMTTGVFVSRYAMVALPGICIALALGFHRLVPAGTLPLATAAALAVAFAAPATYRPSFKNPARERPELMRLLTRERPVLITGGLVYLQLWYYAPPAMRTHLQYMVHLGAARHFTGSDSIDRGLLNLAKWTPVNIVEPRPFVTAHREFFVYEAGSGWLVHWLREGKAEITKLGSEANTAILAVRHTF